MRTMAFVLSILLCAGASTARSDAGGAAPPAATLPPKVIQLAESNSKSPNKTGGQVPRRQVRRHVRDRRQ